MRLNRYLIEQILEFPDSRQSTDISCGASAVQSVLMYYGKEFREEVLMDKLSTDNDGTRPVNMVKYLKSNGLDVTDGKITVDDIKKSIDDGYPVIILIQAWGKEEEYSENKNGHYVVAIGYDGDKIIFDDPSLMSNKGYLTTSELEKRWHDVDTGDNKVLQNYGIIAKGQKKYDSKKIKEIQ